MAKRVQCLSEKNDDVRKWSENTQRRRDDIILARPDEQFSGYVHLHLKQNDTQELAEIWGQWKTDQRQMLYDAYGDIAYLLQVHADKGLIRAMAQFWNPLYNCFTFNGEDMTPTIEEYTALLHLRKVHEFEIYVKGAQPKTYKEKLMILTGTSMSWVEAQFQGKGGSEAIAWDRLRGLIHSHPEPRKQVDIFALGIYGLIIFPKVVGHIEVSVIDLFGELELGLNLVPAILAETFRSLNFLKRHEGVYFIGCVQLLTVWMHSHLGAKRKLSRRVHTPQYPPLREFLTEETKKEKSSGEWESILRDLRLEDITWRAYWLDYNYILYKCGAFDWVPLLGLWGATGYAPLLVSRQYGSLQFVPATRGLGLCEFFFKGEKSKKQILEIARAWAHPYQARFGPLRLTSDYQIWRTRRKNCNIPPPSQGNAPTLEERFREMSTEADIVRQECEEEKKALNKRIAELEAKNKELDYNATYFKNQSKGFEKQLSIVSADLKDLQGDYRGLQEKIRNTNLHKTPQEWEQEIRDRENDAKRCMKLLKTKENRVEEVTANLQAAQRTNTTTLNDLMASRAQNQEL
ncbi:hypothetical protein HRI_000811700 [Hibiscus trionum]|uniref:DUF7745 domain-containing protein n=1 Tax=Hibiscus trionum TaxID=183268 RepID=A0A9W7H5J5_HIBTR|nr:hypothetical protein HRI_000811700 [Hibiscus trionum]